MSGYPHDSHQTSTESYAALRTKALESLLAVAELVDRHERGEKRPERVEALRAHPLPVLALDRPRADIVPHGVAGNVRKRVFGADPPPALADHDGELRLGVDVRLLARQHDRLVRSDERRRELREQDRRLRRLTPALRRVVDVVQPDAHDLPWSVDAEPLAPELADRHVRPAARSTRSAFSVTISFGPPRPQSTISTLLPSEPGGFHQ